MATFEISKESFVGLGREQNQSAYGKSATNFGTTLVQSNGFVSVERVKEELSVDSEISPASYSYLRDLGTNLKRRSLPPEGDGP